jgi:hypothetical protein
MSATDRKGIDGHSCGAAVRAPAQREALRALGYAQESVRSCGAAIDFIRSQCTNTQECSRRSEIIGNCLPKARRLALGRALALLRSWFKVRAIAGSKSVLLKAVEYSSILLPFKRFPSIAVHFDLPG